jgi:hypothetical protein
MKTLETFVVFIIVKLIREKSIVMISPRGMIRLPGQTPGFRYF